MWGEMAEWLKSADIPNDTDLKEDLAGPQYYFRGDNAQILFEFMANPEISSVEWEHIKIGTEDSRRNIVGNSHNSRSSALVGYHFNTGYTIRESNHNHPSGNMKPSDKDIYLRNMIQLLQPNAKFYVYVHLGTYVNFSEK